MIKKESADVEARTLDIVASAPGKRFWIATSFLAASFIWALLAWAWQIKNGLGETGLGVPVFWGVYIINFVWFIGISHAGTLISAILRITDAHWRRPFTRVAEAITIASVPFAATCVIVDLGRPDRLFNIIFYPHLTSPLLWDVLCISTYITVSCLYFYMALIPDLALCRDRLKGMVAPWRSRLYEFLSIGWKHTEEEKRLHHRLMTVMSVILLALVVSVHTNVGYVFGMTSKIGWHSEVIGPYFVIGAALQGLGVLGTFIVVIRWIWGLESFITESDLRNLKKFFLAVCCFWMYFTFCEFLTIFYGQHMADMAVFWAKFAGSFSWDFWSMLLFCFAIPFYLLVFYAERHLEWALFWAGISDNLGMWLERFGIIVPSGTRPFLSWGIGHYRPSWVEISITVGWCAGFILLFLAIIRLFPVLTIWEMTEEG